MEEQRDSPASEFRLALRVGGLTFVLILLIYNYRFILEVFQILTNPDFLRGFGDLLLITVLVSILGGGLGIALGKLIQLNDWLSRSANRFLRLGMWLPFFVFWALPIWRVGDPKYLLIVFRMSSITVGIIAAFPTVLLGSCYYYLSSRVLLEVRNRPSYLQVVRSVFLFAFLICVVWQLFFPRPWPWSFLVNPISIPAASFLESVRATSFASMILIM